jgi:hypothetical protein
LVAVPTMKPYLSMRPIYMGLMGAPLFTPSCLP